MLSRIRVWGCKTVREVGQMELKFVENAIAGKFLQVIRDGTRSRRAKTANANQHVPLLSCNASNAFRAGPWGPGDRSLPASASKETNKGTVTNNCVATEAVNGFPTNTRSTNMT